MVTLRQSALDDADGLARCVDAVARERRYLAATEGFGADATRQFLARLDERRGVQVLAVGEGGAVVGWCDVMPHSFEGMRHVGRLGMGVLAAWRGQGLGRRLLREALAAAAARGLRRVELEVFASNRAAIRLYEGAGFGFEGRRLGARQIDGCSDDILMMALDLADRDRPARQRAPAPIGSPVLDSVVPVVQASRHVRTCVAKIAEHARWMACEELPFPDFGPPFDPATRRDELVDFVMVSTAINTAFTDFATGVVFQTEYEGRRWSDAEAMMACLRRAMDAAIPVLDGRFLASATRHDLAGIFEGSIEMPMLDEKQQVLNDIGATLARHYDGRFSRFVESCAPRLFDEGRGLVDRLVREFPRFNDVSRHRGREVRIYKLAQLAFWVLHCTLRRHGGFRIDDLASMTAFADYIVPMALRAMAILEYTPALDAAIAERRLLGRDSEEEVEIRAHTIYATSLLTEEINARRPADRQIIIPQLDARLWQGFHATHAPHHLTRTIMY